MKPDFTEDLDLAAVSIYARYLYENLWCRMDKSGVTEAHPKLIKQWIFPYDDQMTTEVVAKLLSELVEHQFLIPIQYHGKDYFYCPTLRRHQKFHVNETVHYQIPDSLLSKVEEDTSTHPAPTQHPTGSVPVPEQHPSSSVGNGQLVIGNGDGERSTGLAPELQDLDHGGLLEKIPIPAQESWINRFGVDLVREEIPKAKCKWLSNPDRARLGKFSLWLHAWFEIAENERARAPASQAPISSPNSYDAIRREGELTRLRNEELETQPLVDPAKARAQIRAILGKIPVLPTAVEVPP